MMQLMNSNPPPSVLPSLSRDRCADSMAPSLKELSFMEAELSARHEWLQAFGCPMYFQTKSMCFMPNIQRQYQRWKAFLRRVQQMPHFLQIPFNVHACQNFLCLPWKTHRQMYLTCKLSFFSHAAHILLCLAFIPFLLDIYSSAASKHFSPSVHLHLTRYTPAPSPHTHAQETNQLKTQPTWVPKHLNKLPVNQWC